jgi:hypothetical protein
MIGVVHQVTPCPQKNQPGTFFDEIVRFERILCPKWQKAIFFQPWIVIGEMFNFSWRKKGDVYFRN